MKPDELAFKKTFTNGCGFWTSEDGSLTELVIEERDDWREVLKREFAHVFEHEKFNEKRWCLKHVARSWVGKEWFNGPNSSRRGKLWSFSDKPTPFVVVAYELEIPR